MVDIFRVELLIRRHHKILILMQCRIQISLLHINGLLHFRIRYDGRFNLSLTHYWLLEVFMFNYSGLFLMYKFLLLLMN